MPLKRRSTLKDPPRYETVDELLAVVTGEIQASSDDISKKEQQVRGFILDSKLTTGNACIPAAYVFSSFLSWAAVPLTKHTFSRYFNVYFKPYVTRGFIYYRLNVGALGLPEDYSCWNDTAIQYFYKDKTAKYKGVAFIKEDKRRGYYVDYYVDGARTFHGPYETPEQAALLYDKEIIEKNLMDKPLNFYDKDLVWKPFRDIYDHWKKEKAY